MEEFINLLIEIDNEISKDIINKLKNNQKLTIYEIKYLNTWYQIIKKKKK